jgi:uncharacterized protein YjbI with pentapeptide repeats
MADLPYVSFRQANLEGASLKSADIKSCDFGEAKRLTLEQVSVTGNWQSAKFDPEFWRSCKNSKTVTSKTP